MGMPTSVEVEKAVDTSELFQLFQNYPNAFNSATTIGFVLVRSVYVTLRIHDLLGREIATLVDAELPGGHHHVVWDAGILPSGVYYCRLSTGEMTQTRTMMLVR